MDDAGESKHSKVTQRIGEIRGDPLAPAAFNTKKETPFLRGQGTVWPLKLVQLHSLETLSQLHPNNAAVRQKKVTFKQKGSNVQRLYSS